MTHPEMQEIQAESYSYVADAPCVAVNVKLPALKPKGFVSKASRQRTKPVMKRCTKNVRWDVYS